MDSDFVKEEHGYLEICGIRYSKELFREWGEKGMELGTLFKLTKRENNVVYIERVNHG